MRVLQSRMLADGCELLRLDAAFFDLCCKRLRDVSQPWLIDAYARTWAYAMREEPNPHAKQQTGRYTANQWLLGQVTQTGRQPPTGQEMQALRL